MDKIANAVLKIWDNLQLDEKSEDLLEDLDSAETDEQLKSAIRKGVIRLKEIGKEEIAKQIIEETRGFAY